MECKIYVPEIECDSCVKIISKKLRSLQGIEEFRINKDSVDAVIDTSLVKKENLLAAIKNAGYRASFEPFDRKTLKERINEFRENKAKYDIELKGIGYVIAAFLILTVLEGIAYFGFLRVMPNFTEKYLLWIIYLNISIVALGAAVWHFLSYKAKITCMTGMMIGMTMGMQTGMMLGAILGATNGFFIGAMAGMFLGVAIGIITGKCCGIMGVMQGMMAGVMGGTMGPMIVLMMFADNLLLFMPFYMAINVMILLGFSYMIIDEVAEGKDVKKSPIDFPTFISGCIVAAFLLIMLMLYGPKSVLIA